MFNPYYDPEKLGLRTIGSIDDAGSYEFNTLAAWKDPKTGEVFYASDSGCSCPTPFDGVDRASMTKITDRRAFDAFKAEAANWKVTATERDNFVDDVQREWRNFTRRKGTVA